MQCRKQGSIKYSKNNNNKPTKLASYSLYNHGFACICAIM